MKPFWVLAGLVSALFLTAVLVAAVFISRQLEGTEGVSNMDLRLERLVSDKESTVGALFVDGEFLCWTLEDGFRAQKVAKETRIPAGAYRINLRTEGGMHPRYKERFGSLHRGMLWLQDVPNFEWVYLHVGNNHEHTEGCILVGESVNARRGDMSLQASRDAYRKLCMMVMDAASVGHLTIDIVDRDR